MLEILEFIFADFWHFIGIWFLIYAFFDGIAGIIRALRK
jgi:hypothetical protein